MARYRIAIMEGDGIGPEVVRSARQILEACVSQLLTSGLEFVRLPIGLAALSASGSTVPSETLEALTSCDGWILGPVTTHLYHGPSMPNPSAALRKHFDLFANVRPARSYPGVQVACSDVDLVVFRENTEGFYADRNVLDGNGELRLTEDTVVSVRVVTRQASERIARAGFDFALRHRNRVTVVHKANVLKRGCGLFLEACRSVAADYPDVHMDDYHVDAFAMHLVMRPPDFGVIVTTNLYGDILSDEAAGLVGGLGLAPGLNAGDRYVMAQAVHGSAPDIAGQSVANPIAMILSSAMLLEWLGDRYGDDGMREIAGRMRKAVGMVLSNGTIRTPDLGGTSTTDEVTRAVVAALDQG